MKVLFGPWTLGALLVAFMAQGFGKQQPITVNDIVITPVVAHRWATMYREFSTEFLDCVYGKHIGDKLYIIATVPNDVLPQRSTVNAVTPEDACESHGPQELSLLGDAHSHPHTRETLIGQRFAIPENEDLCYLSLTDMITFKTDGVPLSIVICGQGEFIVALKDGEVVKCTMNARLPSPACATTKVGLLDMDRIPIRKP